ncbi:hypothetical protein NCG89_00905 [Spongiibacter taiwanensis]|uniref:hypothetical protein n=1 Tax=Spongiibacter taiwanensis TaxID=1748242 RepID=UPI0020355875|nr:hypothetical protein [Spongiibacter taiwanensis]USA43362.1 hypothetical protein NCG89_00905 [Spongiibacter taiwanensis]
MIRQNRYTVLKNTDVFAYLSADDHQCIIEILKKISAGRQAAEKPDQEYLVVESDWPEYEPTWQRIQRRVDGNDGEQWPLPHHKGALERAIHDFERLAKQLAEQDDYSCGLPEGDAQSLREVAMLLDGYHERHSTDLTAPGTMAIPVDATRDGKKPHINSAMKAECIGQFAWQEQADYYDEQGNVVEHVATRIVPWDLCKEIYRRMAMAAHRSLGPESAG